MKTNSRMIVLLMTMVSANVVHAQSNSLPNGDFGDAKGIQGWTASGTGTMSFAANIDAENSAASGSLSLYPSTGDNPESATSTCFPVKPLANFSFGGKGGGMSDTFNGNTGEMSCKSYADNSCTEGETDLGSATDADVYESSVNPNFVSFIGINGTLSSSAKTAQCTVSTVDNDPLNPIPSFMEFDDLYFDLQDAASTGFKLGGYLSGSWYDPSSSGQGFALEFTAQGNMMLAYWFTYSPFGTNTEWVYGGGSWDPTQSSVTVPAVLTSGAYFGINFASADVQKTPWGTLTFAFTDCNNALLTWNSTLPSYGSGTQHLKRLTSIAGLSCSQ